MSVDQLIQLYVQLRDKKKEVVDRHKAELEPYDMGLAKLEALMQQKLDESGVEKMGGEHGTVFTKVNSSVTVDDWDSVLDYVRDNEAYDVLEKRVSKQAALERGDVPGLRFSQVKTVNVRRK